MKKGNLLGDNTQEEPSWSQNSKLGISHCERFEINKVGGELFAKQMDFNQNKSGSTSHNSKNNGKHDILINK